MSLMYGIHSVPEIKSPSQIEMIAVLPSPLRCPLFLDAKTLQQGRRSGVASFLSRPSLSGRLSDWEEARKDTKTANNLLSAEVPTS